MRHFQHHGRQRGTHVVVDDGCGQRNVGGFVGSADVGGDLDAGTGERVEATGDVGFDGVESIAQRIGRGRRGEAALFAPVLEVVVEDD